MGCFPEEDAYILSVPIIVRKVGFTFRAQCKGSCAYLMLTAIENLGLGRPFIVWWSGTSATAWNLSMLIMDRTGEGSVSLGERSLN